MTVCPFVSKTCSNTNTNMILSPNSTQSIFLSQKSNWMFNSTAICYYTIKSNLSSFSNQTLAARQQVQINVN